METQTTTTKPTMDLHYPFAMKLLRLTSKHMLLCVVQCLLVLTLISHACDAQEPLPEIPRFTPPKGVAVPQDKTRKAWQELEQVKSSLSSIKDETTLNDIEVVVKAVEYALLHGEFYNKQGIDTALLALRKLSERIKAGTESKRQTGRAVHGYRSSIDGTLQPYALEIAEDVPLNKPVPLYVWLHDRNDELTDLHFILERFGNPGQIAPTEAIVLHPFGRHSLGFKLAGEIDVLEAIEDVSNRYEIDLNKVVLMGGAGVGHLAAHYPDKWAGACAGAGFAESHLFNKTSDAGIPGYTKTLWQVYDISFYARNLLNLQVVAYSGDSENQKLMFLAMEKLFSRNKLKLVQIPEPATDRFFPPDSRNKIMGRMNRAIRQGRAEDPDRGYFQTQTLRYNRAPGVEVMGLDQHWQNTRVDTEKTNDRLLVVATRNVSSIRFPIWQKRNGTTINIDGQEMKVDGQVAGKDDVLTRSGDKWSWAKVSDGGLRKRPGLQGPIDDAFMSSFMVVTPGGKSRSALTRRYVDFEINRFTNRWRTLFRGELRIKMDWQLTEADTQQHNLVLFGDPDSNSYLSEIIGKLPIAWNSSELKIGDKEFDPQYSLPVMIYPNPKNPNLYVVINSGPTFRESHDPDSSLQNPQLPDWAVIDLRQKPDDMQPGRISDADFFDEQWQVKKKAGN